MVFLCQWNSNAGSDWHCNQEPQKSRHCHLEKVARLSLRIAPSMKIKFGANASGRNDVMPCSPAFNMAVKMANLQPPSKMLGRFLISLHSFPLIQSWVYRGAYITPYCLSYCSLILQHWYGVEGAPSILVHTYRWDLQPSQLFLSGVVHRVNVMSYFPARTR